MSPQGKPWAPSDSGLGIEYLWSSHSGLFFFLKISLPGTVANLFPAWRILHCAKCVYKQVWPSLYFGLHRTSTFLNSCFALSIRSLGFSIQISQSVKNTQAHWVSASVLNLECLLPLSVGLFYSSKLWKKPLTRADHWPGWDRASLF
jgi:hypothetical protein